MKHNTKCVLQVMQQIYWKMGFWKAENQQVI